MISKLFGRNIIEEAEYRYVLIEILPLLISSFIAIYFSIILNFLLDDGFSLSSLLLLFAFLSQIVGAFYYMKVYSTYISIKNSTNKYKSIFKIHDNERAAAFNHDISVGMSSRNNTKTKRKVIFLFYLIPFFSVIAYSQFSHTSFNEGNFISFRYQYSLKATYQDSTTLYINKSFIDNRHSFIIFRFPTNPSQASEEMESTIISNTHVIPDNEEYRVIIKISNPTERKIYYGIKSLNDPLDPIYVTKYPIREDNISPLCPKADLTYWEIEKDSIFQWDQSQSTDVKSYSIDCYNDKDEISKEIILPFNKHELKDHDLQTGTKRIEINAIDSLENKSEPLKIDII